MQVITSDVSPHMAAMLEGYDCPAILVTADYRILATNELYRASFGDIPAKSDARCYKISHGYDVPCDQAGESCPLAAARRSGNKERVLHIHQTPGGREHVDVEMLPIVDADGQLRYFVELLKPVPVASAEINDSVMVGVSNAFNNLVANITRVGPTEASVLLLGESGTGKELAAKAIHQASVRSEAPMVTLECSGLTESLFESELFGYVKGAFTGAQYDTPGLVAVADGGTLFLDEIGDVPLSLQIKLLRLIESGTYRAVGSREPRRTDFRLVCATHKNLRAMVENGEFRQDLYYRINVFPIRLPSLLERAKDIPLLARSILAKLDASGRARLSDDALQALQRHIYHGNIRELRNILARALVLCNAEVIDAETIAACQTMDAQAAKSASGSGSWPDLKTQELLYLQRLLAHCEGDKKRTAKIAGISLRSLYRRLDDGQFADHSVD